MTTLSSLVISAMFALTICTDTCMGKNGDVCAVSVDDDIDETNLLQVGLQHQHAHKDRSLEDEVKKGKALLKPTIRFGPDLSPSMNICSVSINWEDLACAAGEESISEIEDMAANAIDGKLHHHFASWKDYTPYHGLSLASDGNLVDFMGFVVPNETYCNSAYMPQVTAHALRVRQCNIYTKLFEMEGNPVFQTRWPVVSEEYFEYIDVLNAVSDYARLTKQSERKFVFVEIGAGYGHWTFTAHKGLMQKAPQASYKYVMVDVVSELLPVIAKLAALNDVNMSNRQDSPLNFHHGMLGGGGTEHAKNQQWYVEGWGLTKNLTAQPAEPISLGDLLDLYGVPCEIDMVDVDIQGSEYDLFNDEAMELLTARARRVHIGTHPGGNETLLAQQFQTRGWKSSWSFPRGKLVETEFGPVDFGDGVLSFVNTGEIGCHAR